MNSTRYSQYGDDGAGAADMMAAFANAMRDVYTVGLGLFSSIAAAANASTGGIMPSAGMMPDFSGAGAADMMAAFANGMRDVCTVGLGLLSSIAAAANASTGGMMPSARMMPDFSGTGGERIANNLRGASTQLADVAPYLAEAAAIAMASYLRYGQSLTEIAGRRQWALMQAGAARITGQAASAPEECTVLVEEVRAYLREVGETASLEARRLERDLAQIGENLARIVVPSSPDAPYRRTWAAKP
jgi:hypothetical protein